MKRLFIIVIAALLVTVSCERDEVLLPTPIADEDTDYGEPGECTWDTIPILDDDFLWCLDWICLDTHFVISSDLEYLSAITLCTQNNTFCDTIYTFPTLDFSTEMVLGSGVRTGNNIEKVIKYVLRCDEQRKIVYHTDVFTGDDNLAAGRDNIISIAKPPVGYTISFEQTVAHI